MSASSDLLIDIFLRPCVSMASQFAAKDCDRTNRYDEATANNIRKAKLLILATLIGARRIQTERKAKIEPEQYSPPGEHLLHASTHADIC